MTQKIVRHKVVGAVLEIEPNDGFATRARLPNLERHDGGIVHCRGGGVSAGKKNADDGKKGDSPMPASWGLAAATPVMLNRDKKGLYAMAVIISLTGFVVLTMLSKASRMVGTIAWPATAPDGWVRRAGVQDGAV